LKRRQVKPEQETGSSTFHLFLDNYLFCRPEDGSSIFIRNFAGFLANYILILVTKQFFTAITLRTSVPINLNYIVCNALVQL
jgi:hypothetical protein